MTVVVCFLDCGSGPKNRIDHASLQSSKNVWRAITGAASVARKFPQNELWRALDSNLPEKSSAVKVAVQAHCLNLLEFSACPRLDEWKRLSRVVARGALALFSAATAQWDSGDAYEPFCAVGNRSEVIVPECARAQWEAAIEAHEQMLALEDFGALSAAEVGGLFLLTHTPDNWVKVVRVLRLRLLVAARAAPLDRAQRGPQDRRLCAGRARARADLQPRRPLAHRAAATARHHRGAQGGHLLQAAPRRERAAAVRVTRHDLEQAKRKWLQRPQAQKKRPRTEGVAGVVSAAMGAASLAELRPVRGVLRLASEERGALTRRIAALDRLACIGLAWQRVVAEQSAALQTRLMEEVDALARAGEDTEAVRACHTADAVHRRIVELARGVASTSGLQLDPADSVWRQQATPRSPSWWPSARGRRPRARARRRPRCTCAPPRASSGRLFATAGGGGGACGHPRGDALRPAAPRRAVVSRTGCSRCWRSSLAPALGRRRAVPAAARAARRPRELPHVRRGRGRGRGRAVAAVAPQAAAARRGATARPRSGSCSPSPRGTTACSRRAVGRARCATPSTRPSTAACAS